MQDKEGATTPSATAQAVFGLPQESKVLLSRTMADFIFNILASKAPAVGSALRAIDKQIATVKTATEDMVMIVLDQSIALPAAGSNPAVTYDAVTISLSRSRELFDFGISATTSSPGARPLAYLEAGLTARPESRGACTLSEGTEPHLRITPASGAGGVASIEAYTVRYLKGQSAMVRALAPATVGLISLTRLPDAPSASPDEQKAAKDSSATSSLSGPAGDHVFSCQADSLSPRAALVLVISSCTHRSRLLLKREPFCRFRWKRN